MILANLAKIGCNLLSQFLLFGGLVYVFAFFTIVGKCRKIRFTFSNVRINKRKNAYFEPIKNTKK